MKMKISLLMIGVFSFASIVVAQKARGIRAVNFLNRTYKFHGCGDPESVKLIKGKAKEENLNYYIMKGDIVYGDVNGDGQDDAVVMLRCAGGTMRDYNVYAFSMNDGKPKLLAMLFDGKPSPDPPKGAATDVVEELFYVLGLGPNIKQGNIAVRTLVDGTFARPKYMETSTYRLRNGAFELVGTPTKRKYVPK